MDKETKERIDESVENAFRTYELSGYEGHNAHPDIVEESKRNAEMIVEKTGLQKGRSFDYVASLATFLACENHACSITLKMARENSTSKFRMRHLEMAREATGVDPKLNSDKWVGGVIATLRDKHVICKPGEATKIKRKTLSYLPEIEGRHAPRHRAIAAVYKALSDSGYGITKDRITRIFNVSRAFFKNVPFDYNVEIGKVEKYLKKNEEVLYSAEQLKKILNLESNPSVLAAQISRKINTKQSELFCLHTSPNSKSFYGYSPLCGPGSCYDIACGKGNFSCKSPDGKPKFEFFEFHV